MTAMVYQAYGPPESIAVTTVDTPTPQRDQVLVRVKAASINLSDWEMLVGRPLYSRIWGLRRPRFRTLGSDVAGTVVAVGSAVAKLKPGDDVFGDIMGHFGGFAEYVTVPAAVLYAKPAELEFVTAATLPQAAVIALRGIWDRGQLVAGQHVLINGAGGGSGTFAIQLAKARGATVTGVDNEHKQDYMRSAGADHVVDYRREDFAAHHRRYDLVLDLVAYRPLSVYRRILTPRGRYFLVGGSMTRLLQAACVGPLLSLVGGQRLGVLAVEPQPDDFARAARLTIDGTLRPHVERTFPLRGVAEALRRVGEGHACGKVVVTM
ncbi:MAG: NAD(P)-dependent alcohol dehydrogenase [Myxococcales bacterium FL481]|nr:MAG: NAD(P)-dependent alcohol dehydrogenase [Myxococcales bacterium FL481]